MRQVIRFCDAGRALWVAAALVSAIILQAARPEGDWTGRLELGGGRSLKLVLHIGAPTDTVTLDSPDQGAYGLPCETVYLLDDSINIRIPRLMMSYQGRVGLDGVLSGVFAQGNIRLPLSFRPGMERAVRPQTPRPPFPYTEESVTVDAGPGIRLAGTLTVPDTHSATTPVVVLVSGSGAQNRDEELFEHKPFAVMADYLARNGIASLRYDDRGVGESTGDRTDATTRDYAADTDAAVKWLRRQHRFGQTGVIGHSEGGMIAYMLGAVDDGPDFIVSIAGPAVEGARILDYQNKTVFVRGGMTEAQADRAAADARKRLEADPTMKWMHFFLSYNPASDLRNLKIPALIIYGGKDRQVPSEMNSDVARQLAPRATVRSYPGLNHMMQHAPTGAVEEYSSIEETISPEVLKDIATFIQSLQ